MKRVAIGEGAFAGLVVAAALSAANVATSAGLDSPVALWLREILSGYAMAIVFTGGRATARGVTSSAWLVVAACVVVAALIARRRTRVVRSVVATVLASAAFGASLVITLYAGVLAPSVALAIEGSLIALVVARIALPHLGSERLRRVTASALRRGGGGASTVIHVAIIALVFHAAVRRAASLTPSARRFTVEPAYDAAVLGVPRVLLFADQTQIRMVRTPYGGAGPASEPVVNATYAERFLPSADTDVFYVSTSGHGVTRMHLGEPPPEPQFVNPAVAWSVSLTEDPMTRRLFVLNEWDGQGMAFFIDADRAPTTFRVSSHAWPMPWITGEPASRRAFVSTMLADGALRVLDLDTLQITAERKSVFAYQSVIDRKRGLLWATRPMPGELVAFDLATLEPRARIPLAPGTREIALDADAREIFVNTYPFGLLFRVDAESRRVVEIGGCGWRCRSIFIDDANRTLWTASRDGVYRFPLDEPFAGAR